jgi:hypothetical protein
LTARFSEKRRNWAKILGAIETAKAPDFDCALVDQDFFFIDPAVPQEDEEEEGEPTAELKPVGPFYELQEAEISELTALYGVSIFFLKKESAFIYFSFKGEVFFFVIPSFRD